MINFFEICQKRNANFEAGMTISLVVAQLVEMAACHKQARRQQARRHGIYGVAGGSRAQSQCQLAALTRGFR